jgi:hypothetical protein
LPNRTSYTLEELIEMFSLSDGDLYSIEDIKSMIEYCSQKKVYSRCEIHGRAERKTELIYVNGISIEISDENDASEWAIVVYNYFHHSGRLEIIKHSKVRHIDNLLRIKKFYLEIKDKLIDN